MTDAIHDALQTKWRAAREAKEDALNRGDREAATKHRIRAAAFAEAMGAVHNAGGEASE